MRRTEWNRTAYSGKYLPRALETSVERFDLFENAVALLCVLIIVIASVIVVLWSEKKEEL